MRIDPDSIAASRPDDREISLLAAEVRRLQAVIDADGPTLTDEERNAIEGAIVEMDAILQEFIPTPVETRLRRQVSSLRGLLERTK